MKMKLRQFDGTQERKLLTYLIVSKEFVEATPFLKAHHFANSFGQKLYQWCHDFYEQYNDAPSSHIMDMYAQAYPDDAPDDPEQDYIKRLLTSLSGEWEKRREFNLQFAVEQALDFVNRKELEILEENLKLAREVNNRQEALQLIANFKPVTIEQHESNDPFSDEAGWSEAFEEMEQEVLFTLPGAIGELLNEQLYREGFLSFQAPDKAGKTWWIIFLLLRALRERNIDVAFFSCGDQTKSQIYKRLGQARAGLPYRRKRPGKDREETVSVDIPVDFEGNTEARYLDNITGEKAMQAVRTWIDGCNKRHARLRLKVTPNSELTFKEIEKQLAIWKKQDGFEPDIILDDYIDLHAPEAEDRRLDFRHQEGNKWRKASALRQKYDCLYITVTQADADSYEKEHQTKKNFSETKVKNHEVTAMIAMNRNREDKAKHQVRFQPLAFREGDDDPKKEVKVLQCLAIGNPCLRSEWCGVEQREAAKEKKRGSKKPMSQKEKKAKAIEFLKTTDKNVVEIATEVGLDSSTVRNYRAELRKNGEL